MISRAPEEPQSGARKVGGVADVAQIEAPGGDLHQFGLTGKVVDRDQARAAVAGEAPARAQPASPALDCGER